MPGAGARWGLSGHFGSCFGSAGVASLGRKPDCGCQVGGGLEAPLCGNSTCWDPKRPHAPRTCRWNSQASQALGPLGMGPWVPPQAW